MTQDNGSRFVSDGHKRARTAAIERIRAQVETEYAARLPSANWPRRLLLKAEMRREIERRLDRIARPTPSIFMASAER